MPKATMNVSIEVEDIVYIDNLVKNDKYPEFKTRGDVVQMSIAILKKQVLKGE